MFNDPIKKNWRLGLAVAILGGFTLPASAASLRQDITEGNHHFREGAFEASEKRYRSALEESPESDVVHFNLGTALYKIGDYGQAMDYFQKALLTDDGKLKQKAHYNFGNSLYQFGIQQESEDVSAAVSSLEKSLKQYESAISLDGADLDAKNNHAFVDQELKRLQLKQMQQPQNQSQKSDKPQESASQQKQGQQDQKQPQESQGKQGTPQDPSKPGGERADDSDDGRGQEERDQPKDRSQDQDQGQEAGQDQNKKQDQGRGQEGENDYNKNPTGQGHSPSPDALTPQEAQMLLDGYLQEEPQGLLDVNPQTRDVRPVLKDW